MSNIDLDKYLKYKNKYFQMKRENIQMDGGPNNCNTPNKNVKNKNVKNKNVIFITGQAGVGKTTISKKFVKNGYFLLELDKLIEEQLYPLFKDKIDISTAFAVYRDVDRSPYTEEIKQTFIIMTKNIIKKHKKIVIEGGIRNNKVIRAIFGNNSDFTFYNVVPVNEHAYHKRMTSRFVNSPDNYGRLGKLNSEDKDRQGLSDFKKNGIDGQIIKKILSTVSKNEYARILKSCEKYATDFEVNLYVN
jgi:pantothenate kinase